MIDWMFMSVNSRILYYEDNTTFILRASEMQINKYVNMKPFSGPGFFISWGNPLFFYRFFKRTWRYHFLAERLSQSWTREETYHHIEKTPSWNLTRVLSNRYRRYSAKWKKCRTSNINFIC